jgi:hypothetical protein
MVKSMDTKAMKIVYAVTERAGKSYWSRIGICTPNKDGSWNWKLDAIPVNGATIQLRDYDAKDDSRSANDGATNGRRTRDAEAPLV